MILLILFSVLCSTVYPMDLLKEYGKDMRTVAAFTVGGTLTAYGLYGMKHHVSAVQEGYQSLSKKIDEFTKKHETCGAIARYSFPLLALGSGVFLMRKSATTYAFIPDKLWAEYKHDITKWMCFGGGATLAVWGLSGMDHHVNAAQAGYKWTYDKVVELNATNPLCGFISRYAIPIAALGSGLFAFKVALKK